MCTQLSAELTVDQVVTRWPQTISVFLQHQMACVGCHMATFDTLEDVARIYGLSLDGFLGRLRQAIDQEAMEEE